MRYYIKIFIILLIISIFLLAFVYPKNPAPEKNNHIVTVTAKPITKTLFYAGTVQPVKIASVTSLADGIIEKMLFRYGDMVKCGQILFIISSEKFHADYKTILMQYIKTKSEYLARQNELNESKFLHHSHLISDNEFKTKEVNFYNARLEMAQSKASLAAMLKRFDLRGYNIYDLKIEDIDRITRLLQAEDGSQRLKIISPATGVILQPTKSDSNDGELKKIMSGDQIKLGDPLAIISDPSALLVHINVSEFNINQLQISQKVKVTSVAFPALILEGKMIGLNRQGESSQNGIPTFPVDISVVNLTREQQNIIRMGMSVKVAIDVIEGPKIMIPINAVTQKNDAFYVNRQDVKSGKIHEIAVKLGNTSMDSVAIESNLTAGDKIVITD